mgnify:CR=1 FL=1
MFLEAPVVDSTHFPPIHIYSGVGGGVGDGVTGAGGDGDGPEDVFKILLSC